jgi:hypothetical protein
MEFGKETVVRREINAAHRIQPDDTRDVMIAIDLGQRKPRDCTVHIFGDLLHFNARLRHFYARPVAIDQPHAKLILKAMQRLTYCRLCQVQPRSRTTHAALPRYGEKCPQQIPVEPIIQVGIGPFIAHC